jgi:hypothetical protein
MNGSLLSSHLSLLLEEENDLEPSSVLEDIVSFRRDRDLQAGTASLEGYLSWVQKASEEWLT